MDLGEWLAAGAPEEVWELERVPPNWATFTLASNFQVPSGPVMVEIENGVHSSEMQGCDSLNVDKLSLKQVDLS